MSRATTCPHTFTPDALEARTLRAASLDTTFNGTGYNVLVDGFFDAVNAVHALPDGRILAAGVGRGAGFGVTRYTSAGVIDTTFGTNGQGNVTGFSRVEKMLVRPDGRIVVVGLSSTGADLKVTQLTSEGQLDSTFGVGGTRTLSMASDSNEFVSGATLDGNGRIVAVGSVRHGTVTDGQWSAYIARLTATGAVDTSFNSSGTRLFQYGSGDFAYSEEFNDVIVIGTRIIVGGSVDQGVSAPTQPVLLAYTDSGAPDGGFGPAGSGGMSFLTGSASTVTALTRRGTSGLLVASFGRVFARNGDGYVDSSFGGGTGEITAPHSVTELLVRGGDGAIFAAGGISGNYSTLMLSSAGAPDTSFGPSGQFTFDLGKINESFRALSLTSDGKLVLGGRGSGSQDRWATTVARIIGIPPETPSWLAAGSAATWNASTKTLTVTGVASVTADPGADPPTINVAGTSAQLTIAPTSGRRVTLAALNLSGGGRATVSSVGAGRNADNHRVLVLNSWSAT